MKKNIISIIVTTAVCASVMLAVIGIYRVFAAPVLKKDYKPTYASATISIL